MASMLAFLVPLALWGCGSECRIETVHATADSVRVGDSLEVGIAVERPPEGVEFLWIAKHGACDPERSSSLTTMYTPPTYEVDDRVTVEAHKGSKVLCRKAVSVRVVMSATIDIVVAGPADSIDTEAPIDTADTGVPVGASIRTQGHEEKFSIQITEIPPYDAIGGPTRVEPISGSITGVEPRRHRVVIYACTDQCYVQPTTADPYTFLDSDGSFSALTHLGQIYVALLVDESFAPPPTCPSPPDVTDGVLAREVVPGARSR